MDDSDISDLERMLIATKQAGQTYLHAALTKFLLRWIILAFLYILLLHFFPVFKWVLLLLIPVFTYSLLQIYHTQRAFELKIEEIQLLIDEVRCTGT